MDLKYFDVDTAGDRIESLSSEKFSEERAAWEVEDGVHLARQDAIPLFHPVQTGISSCYRLLYNSDLLKKNGISITGNVEVVGHVHGVVTYAHLQAPSQLFKVHDKIPERILCLSGLNSPSFQKVISTIREIDGLFAKLSPADCWIPWKPGTTGEFLTVRFATRVLTPTHQCREAKWAKVPEGQDENDILQRLVDSGQFRFLPENEVQAYSYAPSESPDGLTPVSLSAVRQGALVHCQVSFCAVKTRDGNHLMKLVLRSVLVEDTKLAELAKEKERKDRQKKRSVMEAGEEGTIRSYIGFKAGKKRKILEIGDEERTRKRLSAVVINEGTAH